MKTKLSAHNKFRRLGVMLTSERGQSLVELALLTPILLILVIGIVEMGRYAAFSIEVGNAARAGAQYGAQSLAKAADTTGITNAVQNECATTDTVTCPGTLTLTPAPTTVCGCDNSGTISAMTSCTSTCANHVVVSVKVTARGTLPSLLNYTTPLFGTLSIHSITITSTATQRVAQ